MTAQTGLTFSMLTGLIPTIFIRRITTEAVIVSVLVLGVTGKQERQLPKGQGKEVYCPQKFRTSDGCGQHSRQLGRSFRRFENSRNVKVRLSEIPSGPILSIRAP